MMTFYLSPCWVVFLLLSTGISLTGCKLFESKNGDPAAATTLEPTPTPSPIVTSGLILHLDASQASGTTAYSSGSGCAAASGGAATWNDLTSNHDGTLTGFGGSCSASMAWNGDGTVDGTSQAGPYRLTFDGASSYVNLGTSGIPEATSFTIAAWVRPNALGYWGAITDKYKSGAAATLSLWQTGSDHFDFVTANGTWGDLFSTNTIAAGTWYYLVGTWDGTTKNLYINGALDNSAAPDASTSPCTGAGDLWVGARNSGVGFYDGSISSVQLYSRALSASEVSQNCNANVALYPGANCN